LQTEPGARAFAATFFTVVFAVVVAGVVAVAGVGLTACAGPGVPGAWVGGADDEAGAGGGTPSTGSGNGPGGTACPPSSLTPAGPEATIAPAFQAAYKAYLLGEVPGVPTPLGGCLVLRADPDTLWIAGASERADGALYTVKLRRDACRHIIGFEGTATKVADTPYIDANLLEGPGNTILYSQWPVNKVSALKVGASGPSVTVDLATLGLGSASESPGGLGFVPAPLPGRGQLRTVTWPGGQWWHVSYEVKAGTWAFPGATQAGAASSPMTGNPGGFAYVPAGSPLFPVQSLIVAEWSTSGPASDRVAVYEVDGSGDPLKSTRKEFFSAFHRPWGAYFEPVTGDYLFLTWNGGGQNDRVYLVQGFDKPPPPPEIN
jgi:hypothetical protein